MKSCAPDVSCAFVLTCLFGTSYPGPRARGWLSWIKLMWHAEERNKSHNLTVKTDMFDHTLRWSISFFKQDTLTISIHLASLSRWPTWNPQWRTAKISFGRSPPKYWWIYPAHMWKGGWKPLYIPVILSSQTFKQIGNIDKHWSFYIWLHEWFFNMHVLVEIALHQ